MGSNTNKLILLVVAAVALLLALNIYQKQIGKNLAIVLSVVTIVVVGYVAYQLVTEPVLSNNVPMNNVPLNNLRSSQTQAISLVNSYNPKTEFIFHNQLDSNDAKLGFLVVYGKDGSVGLGKLIQDIS